MSVPAFNSTAAQRSRVLQWLSSKPLTTLQARSELDVMHPAARVMELRSEGHAIATQRTQEHSDSGERHCVARYVLIPAGTRFAGSGQSKHQSKGNSK